MRLRDGIARAVDALAAATDDDHQHVSALGVRIVDHEIANAPTLGVGCMDQGHGAFRSSSSDIVLSVNDDGPRLAPLVEVGAAPGEGARAQSNRTGEFLDVHQTIDGGKFRDRGSLANDETEVDLMHKDCAAPGSLLGS
jgi:hypothetical protein